MAEWRDAKHDAEQRQISGGGRAENDTHVLVLQDLERADHGVRVREDLESIGERRSDDDGVVSYLDA